MGDGHRLQHFRLADNCSLERCRAHHTVRHCYCCGSDGLATKLPVAALQVLNQSCAARLVDHGRVNEHAMSAVAPVHVRKLIATSSQLLGGRSGGEHDRQLSRLRRYFDELADELGDEFRLFVEEIVCPAGWRHPQQWCRACASAGAGAGAGPEPEPEPEPELGGMLEMELEQASARRRARSGLRGCYRRCAGKLLSVTVRSKGFDAGWLRYKECARRSATTRPYLLR